MKTHKENNEKCQQGGRQCFVGCSHSCTSYESFSSDYLFKDICIETSLGDRGIFFFWKQQICLLSKIIKMFSSKSGRKEGGKEGRKEGREEGRKEGRRERVVRFAVSSLYYFFFIVFSITI